MIGPDNRAILSDPVLAQSTAEPAARGAVAEVGLSLNEVFGPQNAPG